MQTYIDTQTQKIWQFDDEVANIHDFHGTPATLIPYTIPVPDASEVLIRSKAAKTAEIKAACALAITSGVNSNALGAAHTYPTAQLDQANLNGLITSSLLLNAGDEYNFWCADIGGIWERRTHTKLQIQSVGQAVVNHVIFQQEKYAQKLIEIDTATAESLALIFWGAI